MATVSDDPARIGSPPTLTAHHAPHPSGDRRGGFGSGCVLARDYFDGRQRARGRGAVPYPSRVPRCGEVEP